MVGDNHVVTAERFLRNIRSNDTANKCIALCLPTYEI